MEKVNSHNSLPYLEKTDAWSSHSIISAWVKEFPPGTRVLDIGTAAGVIGRQSSGLGLSRKGIEPNPEWAEIAREFYEEMLRSTLEAAPDDFLANQEVIICADILEHTVDPQKALQRLVSLQQPGSCFLLSVPNVANLWVRMQLLFGKFNYAENGILDRTHLHFFTRSTFIEMLSACNLRIEKLKYSPIPLNLVNPFFQTTAVGRSLHDLLARVTRGIPTLFAYQFVAKTILENKEGS